MPSRAYPLTFCDVHSLTCDEHPGQSWPHDECLGAGVDCLRIDCMIGRDNLRVTLLNLLLFRPLYTDFDQAQIDQQVADITTKLMIWEQSKA
jgi:hypothetical protein